MKEAFNNIAKVFIGISLIIVAIILILLSITPAFIWLTYNSIINENRKARNILKGSATFFYNIAASFDQTGCVAFGGFFSWWFLTKEAKYKFGQFYDTISFVLGCNQISGTLSKDGQRLVDILDWFEKGHCLKAYIAGVDQARTRLDTYNDMLKTQENLLMF